MSRPDDREEILLLGDTRLRAVCAPVTDFETHEFKQNSGRLIRALEQFRAEHGFGRAIAAPQIGMPLRMVAMNLGKGPFLLVNPELTPHSAGKFRLWDDCMSFPWLLVRLERHLHVNLKYQDEKGAAQMWPCVEQAVSELLQHEVDHLNGILAVDRALDRESIIARKVYESQKPFFHRQVDYVIKPTIG